MARTYWAEGRQIAKLIHAIGIITAAIISLAINSFLIFFIVIIIFSIIGAIVGAKWTDHRRKQRDLRNQTARVLPTTNNKKKNEPINTNGSLSENDLLLADIDTLSGDDFEKLIAMYYKWKGYEVKIIGGSGDHGVDLVLKGKDGMKIAVQCKRWKDNVGNEVVHNVNSGKRMYDCLAAWVVTTSYFTPKAKEAAERLRVKLINGIEVHDMIKNLRKHHRIVKTK